MNREQQAQAAMLRELIAHQVATLSAQGRIPQGLCTRLDWSDCPEAHVLVCWVDQLVMGWPQRHALKYALDTFTVDRLWPDMLRDLIVDLLVQTYAGPVAYVPERRYA